MIVGNKGFKIDFILLFFFYYYKGMNSFLFIIYVIMFCDWFILIVIFLFVKVVNFYCEGF